MANTLFDSTYNKKNGRYVLGGTTEVSPGFVEWWERQVGVADSTDLIYVFESKYEGKPWMLGQIFYSDPGLWWVICQYNNILEPLTELVGGTYLLIPSLNRVTNGLFTSPIAVGGVASTRT